MHRPRELHLRVSPPHIRLRVVGEDVGERSEPIFPFLRVRDPASCTHSSVKLSASRLTCHEDSVVQPRPDHPTHGARQGGDIGPLGGVPNLKHLRLLRDEGGLLCLPPSTRLSHYRSNWTASGQQWPALPVCSPTVSTLRLTLSTPVASLSLTNIKTNELRL